MTKEHNNVSTKWGSAILVFVITAVVALFFVFIIMNNQKAEDVTITGNTTIAGVSCESETLISPLLVDVRANSYSNKISATFSDDKLRSITYHFMGTYDSNNTASFADGMAIAKYNETIENYGVKESAFSYTHSVEGELLNINLTTDSENLTSTVAPLFLLRDTNTFPKSLDSFVDAYEKEGFVCKIIK